MSARISVQSIGGTKFTQSITARVHTLTGDEPETMGGADSGPTPYEFLLAALGT